jgi:DNA ligase-1
MGIEEKLEGRRGNLTVWPQLYAKASTGKIKTWQIAVTDGDEDGTAIIWTNHGYVDGKMQLKPKPIKSGKNIGKKNETTAYKQACLEAISSQKKKIEQKKYITEIPTDDNTPDIWLPMLAKKYKGNNEYPCMVQKKLNGVRSLNKKIDESTIDIRSRKFKSYNKTMRHLHEPIRELLQVDQYFDGELYRYGWTFQQILRRVKKLREDSNQVQLWVYDIADESMVCEDRIALYNQIIPDNHPNIIKVETEIANNEDELEEIHQRNVGLGFEGSIIRFFGKKYRFDYRSPYLLKKKDFIDKEFVIVGSEVELIAELNESTGQIQEYEAAVFVFDLGDGSGRTFSARPRGTVEDRVRWHRDIGNIIGKEMTVRFLEYSEDGIPHGNTVGVAFRDYE